MSSITSTLSFLTWPARDSSNQKKEKVSLHLYLRSTQNFLQSEECHSTLDLMVNPGLSRSLSYMFSVTYTIQTGRLNVLSNSNFVPVKKVVLLVIKKCLSLVDMFRIVICWLEASMLFAYN